MPHYSLCAIYCPAAWARPGSKIMHFPCRFF